MQAGQISNITSATGNNLELYELDVNSISKAFKPAFIMYTGFCKKLTGGEEAFKSVLNGPPNPLIVAHLNSCLKAVEVCESKFRFNSRLQEFMNNKIPDHEYKMAQESKEYVAKILNFFPLRIEQAMDEEILIHEIESLPGDLLLPKEAKDLPKMKFVKMPDLP